MTGVGILGYGSYIPSYRIRVKDIRNAWPQAGSFPGIQEKAVADFDEDVVTMGVEAAEKALAMAGLKGEQVDALFMATTSSPFAEKSAAVIVQTVLDLPKASLAYDINSSCRSGSLAIRAAIDYIRSNNESKVLVVIADNRLPTVATPPEVSLGAAAAAFVFAAAKDNVLCEIEAWASASDEHTTRWRESGSNYLRFHEDPRIERDNFFAGVKKVTEDLLKKGNFSKDDVKYIVSSQMDGRAAGQVSKDTGLKNPADYNILNNLVGQIGDTGSCAAYLNLIALFDGAQPGERGFVVSYGVGAGCDGFAFKLTDALIEARKKQTVTLEDLLNDKQYLDYIAFAKRMGFLEVAPVLPDPNSGYPNQPNMKREVEEILSLKAQLCSKCGSINFPKRHYCIDCRSTEFTTIKLPRRAKLVTFNIQHVLAIGPEEPPVIVGTAKIIGATGERGGHVSAAMISCDADKVKVGTEVELIFRRCGEELGIPKYGYKFKPCFVNGGGAE
ncbi:MAG: hydroxymethylglutaryl-CoA synthase [Dethiobacteria bacterium]|jgi:hydroxymethylglutaryl-CoA synthase